MKRLGFALSLLLVVVGVCATPWPPYYEQDPIHARVIDAATGAPVAGVAVVAIWRLQVGMWGNQRDYRHDEARTDGNGNFVLRGWGPHPRKRGSGLFTDQDPVLFFYKPGYQALRLDNSTAYVRRVHLRLDGKDISAPERALLPGQMVEPRSHWRSPALRRYCYWNGKTIPILRTTNHQDDLDALAIAFQFDTLSEAALPIFWRLWMDGYRAINSRTERNALPTPPIHLGRTHER